MKSPTTEEQALNHLNSMKYDISETFLQYKKLHRLNLSKKEFLKDLDIEVEEAFKNQKRLAE